MSPSAWAAVAPWGAPTLALGAGGEGGPEMVTARAFLSAFRSSPPSSSHSSRGGKGLHPHGGGGQGDDDGGSIYRAALGFPGRWMDDGQTLALLTVNSCIKVRLDLQVDKSPVVVKGPFFPRVVNPRYRIRGTMCNVRIQSSKARKAIL
jgi:hypothetical protein